MFYERDLHQTDVSPATVMSIYLLPEVNLMIRTRLLATLKPGTRVVSHDYGMGKWLPDHQEDIAAPGKTVGIGEKSKIFYWVVPGKAAGRWRWQLAPEGRPADFELVLQQNFQMIEGTLTTARRRSAKVESRLVGETIAFKAELGGAQYEFSGRISGDAIEGKARVTARGRTLELPWNAKRVESWDARHAKLTREDALKDEHN